METFVYAEGIVIAILIVSILILNRKVLNLRLRIREERIAKRKLRINALICTRP